MTNQLGYCTNVHAGANLKEMRQNLARHSVAVKQAFSPDKAMPVGLWFSAKSAEELIEESKVAELGGWLSDQGLLPFTLNGFPYGNFHQESVKHSVYLPNWESRERVDYTLQLIDILDQLLPEGVPGSLSTLPVAWRSNQLDLVVENLVEVARRLHRLKQDRGREICLCLEPEPGCHLQYAKDAVGFFSDFLPSDRFDFPIRDYLTICHDVCHAAVMFESQESVLAAYGRAGIRVGKVQISSAIEVPFAELSQSFGNASEVQAETLTQLREFAEDRYLHQTVCRNETTGETTFFEDLPLALRSIPAAGSGVDRLSNETWRIHFHVPLFLSEFGRLKSTQTDTIECCNLLTGDVAKMPHIGRVEHFEVETYAWSVLPAALQVGDLAEGIASEMKWAEQWFPAT